MVYNQRYCAIDCLVRNLSETGARLVFASAALIPTEFDLFFRQKGHSRRVELVWRNETDVGVQFIDEHDAPIPLEAAQAIKALKSQNERLVRRLSEMSEPAI